MAVAVPVTASAQAIAFERLPRYSYATFKTDAPLETAVGPTADAGLVGDLAVDPARPQAAKGTVKVRLKLAPTFADHACRSRSA